MKILPILFLCLTFTQAAFAVNIIQAAKNNQISYSIYGNADGTHYHTPVMIEVQNLTSTNLNLDLDNGYMLEAEDSSNQNFVLTQDLIFVLKPKEKKQLPIYAMCIERGDAAPDVEDSYRFSSKANPDLVLFSDFIEKQKLFEPTAQFLMWDLADGDYYADNPITGFELDGDGNVYAVSQIGSNKVILGSADEMEEEESTYQKLVHGSFTMNLSKPKNIHIAMFNANNVIVKELYRNPKTPTGTTELEYSFDSLEYPEPEYFVKLIIDGEVQFARRIQMTN
ncbi:MAG: hypothetical protein R2772_11570 [Chitinophagales bacterium]